MHVPAVGRRPDGLAGIANVRLESLSYAEAAHGSGKRSPARLDFLFDRSQLHGTQPAQVYLALRCNGYPLSRQPRMPPSMEITLV